MLLEEKLEKLSDFLKSKENPITLIYEFDSNQELKFLEFYDVNCNDNWELFKLSGYCCALAGEGYYNRDFEKNIFKFTIKNKDNSKK